MTGWLSHRHIYHLSRAVVISYYTCKVSCNHLYLSISKWSRCIFSVLWKGKLREKEVQWVLLGPTVWQREFQVRSETCCLLSKLLRAPLLPVTVSGKCKFVKDAVRRIGPRGLCAFTDFPGCLCTARDSTANHVIHTRCLRTGESITCSSTGWDCSLWLSSRGFFGLTFSSWILCFPSCQEKTAQFISYSEGSTVMMLQTFSSVLS